MKTVVVRYKVKADRVAENESLVKAVYAELKEKKPAGLRYATMKAADGVSFIHLAAIESGQNPLAQLNSFKAFQADIKDRCDEPPQPVDVSILGAYEFFGE